MSEKKHHKRGELSHRDSTERMKKQAEISRSQHRAAIIKRLRVATPQELEQQPEPVVEVNEQILARAVEQLKNADASIRRTGLRCLRQCLCSTFTGDAIDAVISLGAVPYIGNQLTGGDEESVTEALWCLTNIATGTHEQTGQVLAFVPIMLSLLSAGVVAWSEQVCWCVGNIAGDSDEYRATLIANGVCKPLLDTLQDSVRKLQSQYQNQGQSQPTTGTDAAGAGGAAAQSPLEVLAQTAAWAFSNLARGNTSAEVFINAGATNCLVGLLLVQQQGLGLPASVCKEVCWVFAFLTAKEDAAVQHLITLGLLQALAGVLMPCPPDNTEMLIPVIRSLGNISSGVEGWLDQLLTVGPGLDSCSLVIRLSDLVVHHLANSSSSGSKAVVKESLWALMNIVGGTYAQLALVLKMCPGVVSVVCAAVTSGVLEFQREAVAAMQNMYRFEGCRNELRARPVVGQLVQLFQAHEPSLGLALMRLLFAMVQLPQAMSATAAAVTQDQIDWYTFDYLMQLDVLSQLDWYQYGPVDETVRVAANTLADVFEMEPPHDASELSSGFTTPSPALPAHGHGMGMGVGVGESVFSFGGAGGTIGVDNGAVAGAGRGRGRGATVPAWMNNFNN